MDIRTHKEDSCWMISGFMLGAVFETSGAPAQKRCGRERYNCAPLVLVPPAVYLLAAVFFPFTYLLGTCLRRA